MVKKLNIKNFRGIKQISLDNLSKVNILLGNNASSKTSVLDAIFIAINPNNPELAFRTNAFRGIGRVDDINGTLFELNDAFWSPLFYKFDVKNNISISFSGKYQRELLISAKLEENNSNIIEERNIAENFLGSTNESSIKKINGLSIQFQTTDIHTKYKSSIERTSSGLNMQIDKKYIEALSGVYLNNITFVDPQSIMDKFSKVIQSKKTEQLIKFMQNFEPHLKGVVLSKYGIEIDDDRYPNTVSINNYGDGMLKAFHIAVNALSHSNIMLIDEIENGLHWSKQEAIWRFILELTNIQKQQIFITTHSIELLQNLQSILKKIQFSEQDLRFYRLEHQVDDSHKVVSFDFDQLKSLLSNSLEIR